MNFKRVLSLFLVVALLCTCTPVYFPVAEATVAETQTEEPTVLYTVGDMGVEGAVVVNTISAALAKISEKNKQWEADASVEIRIQGDAHSGGAQNGLLFGQTTIWRANGTKLPITIRGVDTETKGDSYIYLDAVGGWYACANDYTFINLTLPIGDHGTQFYAGSGNIKFEDVFFNRQGRPKINNVDEQNTMYTFQLNVAQTICADENDRIIPDVSNIPVGDAWQWLREYDYEIGDGLAGRNGTYYGDYLHDGDVGGGQYLNACVYFETLTGLSCVGNTWRPTEYHLDDDFVALLQQAAHETVTAVYGEDFYKTSWTDKVGNDNKMNVLLLGSSNGSYFIDELPMIAKAAGITMTVVHAYYSGLRLNVQWSWIESGSGNYRVYTVENGIKTDIDNQKIGDFLTARPWDAIVTYQTSNAFYDYKFTDADAYEKVLADCDKAYDLYNYMYNYDNQANAGADYYWFQTAAAVIGAPGNSTDTKGSIFADNCTQAVFSGWDELEEGEKVTTSVTFGNNVSYRVNTAVKVAAVGFLDTPPETPFNSNTARDVTYWEKSGYEDVADIRPADVKATLIIDGDYASVGYAQAKFGYAPSDAVLLFKNGTAFDLYASHPADAYPDAHFYGDITMELAGGNILRNVRGAYGTVDGDVTMIFSGLGLTTTVNTVGGTINGNFTLDVRDGNLDCWVISGGSAHSSIGEVTGTSTFRWGGGYIKELHFGRSCNIGKLVNEFYCNPNAKIAASTDYTFNLAGHASCNVAGDICNTFIGAVPSGVLNKIGQFGGGNDAHTKIINTVKADAQGNAPTFTAYYGGVSSGTVSEIINNIEAGTFKSFYGGSKIASATTKITNNISGGNFIGTTVLGSAVSGENIPMTATITGGTFPFDPSQYVPQEGCNSVIDNMDGSYTVSDHNYVIIGGELPTCVKSSVVEYGCTGCDATKTVELPIDPAAHDWDKTDPQHYFCKNGCNATSNISHPIEHLQKVYCEGCKAYINAQAWTPIQLNADGSHVLMSGHYYLAEDITSDTTGTAALYLNSSTDVACVHLNGYDITATATRVFFGNGGINIMGDGNVTGFSTGALVGGAVHLNGYTNNRATGNINIYGGVYKASEESAAAISIGTTGGTVGIHGTAEVYGPLVIRGTENDATEVANLIITSGTIKGALRGWTAHNQNITISGGVFEKTGFFTDYAHQDTGSRELSIVGGTFAFDPSAYITEDYAVTAGENGTYTVEEKLRAGLTVVQRPNKTEYAVGETIEEAGLLLKLREEDGTEVYINEGYVLSGFDSSAAGKTTVTVAYGDFTATFGLAIVDDTIAAVDSDGNVYTSFTESLEKTAAGNKVTLLKAVEADVTVDKDLCIDLNGNRITGIVSVVDGCTLYGVDAKTDDYTIDDADGYGKIKVRCEGSGKVMGLPEESLLAKDGYLMITEGEYISFHRVNLQISAMTLRASAAGVYFKSNFAGDEMVAAQVETFGVALSIKGAPTAENLTSDCQYSYFSNFVGGENNKDATSTLLKGIVKEENPFVVNKSHSELPVYSRAYIKLVNGDYLFGASVQRSFRQQIEAVDAIWEKLDLEQKQSVVEMYQAYEDLMSVWNIPTIKEAAQ